MDWNYTCIFTFSFHVIWEEQFSTWGCFSFSWTPSGNQQFIHLEADLSFLFFLREPNFQLIFIVKLYFESYFRALSRQWDIKLGIPCLSTGQRSQKNLVSPFQSCITSKQSSVHTVHNLYINVVSFCKFPISYLHRKLIPDIIFLWRTHEHTAIAFPLAFRALEDLEPDYEEGKVTLKIVHRVLRFPKVQTSTKRQRQLTAQ